MVLFLLIAWMRGRSFGFETQYNTSLSTELSGYKDFILLQQHAFSKPLCLSEIHSLYYV